MKRINFIDGHIFGRMKKDGIPHAALSSDEEFARRAWLDATGRIPAPADLELFLNSKDPDETIGAVDYFRKARPVAVKRGSLPSPQIR